MKLSNVEIVIQNGDYAVCKSKGGYFTGTVFEAGHVCPDEDPIPGNVGLYYCLIEFIESITFEKWMDSGKEGVFIDWFNKRNEIRKEILSEVEENLCMALTKIAGINDITFPDDEK